MTDPVDSDRNIDELAPPHEPVLIGSPPTSIYPSGSDVQTVTAFGAFFRVKVTDPSCVPFCEVVDLEQAAWWLDLVYGEDNATAVVGAVRRGEVPVLDESRLGRLAPTVSRLAVGLWIQRWWPLRAFVPLAADQEFTMDVEVGALAYACQHVLGGLDLADQYLAPRAEEVLDRFSAERDTIDRALGLVVVEACAMAAGTDEDFDRFDALRADIEARGTLSDAEIVDFLAGQASLAGAMSAPFEVITKGYSAVVDARSLAPRIVESAQWSDRGGEVVVTADAGSRVPVTAAEEVWARVYVDGELLPVATFPLERTDGSYVGRWRPGRLLDPNTTLVDIMSPGYASPPRPSQVGALRDEIEQISSTLASMVAIASSGIDLHVDVRDLGPREPWRAWPG